MFYVAFVLINVGNKFLVARLPALSMCLREHFQKVIWRFHVHLSCRFSEQNLCPSFSGNRCVGVIQTSSASRNNHCIHSSHSCKQIELFALKWTHQITVSFEYFRNFRAIEHNNGVQYSDIDTVIAIPSVLDRKYRQLLSF